MNPFEKAISSGYDDNQIINFIGNSYPEFSSVIKKAFKFGYTPKKIVNFLSNMFSSSQRMRGGTEASQEKLSGERAKNFASDVGNLALTAGAAYAATKAAPSIARGLKGILGTGSVTPGSNGSSIGPHPMANAPVAAPTIGTPNPQQAQTIAEGLPQQQVPPPQQTTAPSPVGGLEVDSGRILRDMGLEGKIRNLQKAGNTPDAIAAGLEVGLTPGQKRWLDGEIKQGRAKPIQSLVEDFLTAQPQTPEKLDSPTNLLPKSNELVEGPTYKPEKGQFVMDPRTGVLGNLQHVRNTDGLLDSEGKIHKVKVDDIVQSPLAEKDLADLYGDVIQGVEKETGEQVSRNVNWAGYDPNTNTLAYLPHLGGLYTYENIDPEEAKILTSILNTRKTSGENFIGAWKEGSKSPIGAAMSALIKQLQSEAGGKGKEYSHKFETLYNALEPAMKAAKKKAAEEKRKKKR